MTEPSIHLLSDIYHKPHFFFEEELNFELVQGPALLIKYLKNENLRSFSVPKLTLELVSLRLKFEQLKIREDLRTYPSSVDAILRATSWPSSTFPSNMNSVA